MSDTLEINGKKLHPIKDVVDSVSYSRDYITRLARDKKIIATNIGRQWFVDIESLKSYAEASQLELEIRKKQLSYERSKELEIRDAVELKKSHRLQREKTLSARAATVASLVLCFGLMTGFTADYLFGLVEPAQMQVANAPASSFQSDEVKFSENEINSFVSGDTVEDIAVAHVAYFAPEIKSLQIGEEGILLFPKQSTSSTKAEEFFSDEVVVETSVTGEQVIVMLDSKGKKVGNSIPFVIVPIEEANKVYEN